MKRSFKLLYKLTKVTNGMTDFKNPSSGVTTKNVTDDLLGCCGPAARSALEAVSAAALSRSFSYATSKDLSQAITQVQKSEGG